RTSFHEGTMKKSANATTTVNQPMEQKCELMIRGHEHIHAANCGHKSFVHGDHICYQHDGHFHYSHDGHSHQCEGPHAAKGNNAPAKVLSMADARARKK
ncbi:hypothetical protein K2X33_07005, partial [bacterium]|nr:hypothetical protein [bacterium]